MTTPRITRSTSIFRFWIQLTLLVCLSAGLPLAAHAQVKAGLKVKRHAPWNLFNTTEAVRFDAVLGGAPAGAVEVEASLVDETGKEIAKKRIPAAVTAGSATVLSVDMGRQPRGYYDLRLKTRFASAPGQTQELAGQCSLGVMEFVDRTAKDVREGGYVFGLKWWGGIQNLREMETALSKLGLQWTRILQNEGGSKDAPERLTSAQIVSE